MSNEQELLSTGDIVAIFNVTRATVADWANSGRIPSFKTLGGHSRFRPDDIRRHLQLNNLPVPERLRIVSSLILVVDDEPSILRTLPRRIRRKYPDVVVETADNGVSALLKIGQSVPDIIILDLLMPRMDGIEVIRRIRADPAFASVKILAMSGYVKDEMSVLHAGADAFFSKGTALNDLMDALADLLPAAGRPPDGVPANV